MDARNEDRSRRRDWAGRPPRRRRARGPRATTSSRSSRSRGVDVITGEGLAEALAGVECVIDAATGPSPDQAGGHGVLHHRRPEPARAPASGPACERMVVVSIIGIDRFTAGYSAAKLAHERGACWPGPIPTRDPARRAVPRVRRPARGLGPPGRRELRAEDAHPARRRPGRRRGAGRPGRLGARPGRSAAPIREIAGPREENLVEAAQLLVARRGDAAAGRGRRATRPTRTATLYEVGRPAARPGRDPRRADVRGVAGYRGGLLASDCGHIWPHFAMRTR